MAEATTTITAEAAEATALEMAEAIGTPVAAEVVEIGTPAAAVEATMMDLEVAAEAAVATGEALVAEDRTSVPTTREGSVEAPRKEAAVMAREAKVPTGVATAVVAAEVTTEVAVMVAANGLHSWSRKKHFQANMV